MKNCWKLSEAAKVSGWNFASLTKIIIISFAEAICAFANDLPDSNEPGFLFLGVKDDGSIAGLSLDNRDRSKFGGLRDDGKILPIPTMSVSPRRVGGHDIVVIEVQPSKDTPVRFDGKCCIRCGARQALASREEEYALADKRTWHILSFDAQPIKGATIKEDIDVERFQREYLPRVVSPEVLQENNRGPEEQMKVLGLIGRDDVPTAMGILAWGKNPSHWFPNAYIQFVRYAGTKTTTQVLNEKEIHGTLPDQLQRVKEIINANICTGLEISDMQHQQRADYPFIALRELITNAVVHRDYRDSPAPIQFYWFSDRVEIHNFGGLYGGLKIADIQDGSRAAYRNPKIAEVMKYMRFMERFGHGILSAKEASDENMNPPPEFTNENNYFLAVVRKKGGMMKTITFFNNKGGVGKTSLVYHIAQMLKIQGHRVIVADLDPQCNLSGMFLTDERIEEIWDENKTINAAIGALFDGTGDISTEPHIEDMGNIGLLVGDLSLTGREDDLSDSWPKCLGGNRRAFRVITSFARLIARAGEIFGADYALIDVGPSLGAINRSAMIASDYVIVPLAPDLFSLQGLRNVGSALRHWRTEWRERRKKKPADLDIHLPEAQMNPLGYLIMRHSVISRRPVKAYQRWIEQMPGEYSKWVLGKEWDSHPTSHLLAHLKDYHSLMPLAQEARKPMFSLASADGAIGAHQGAVVACHNDFVQLTEKIISKIKQADKAT